MSLLTSGDLAWMRDTLGQSLPGTAVVLDPVAAADGQGGEAWTYVASGTFTARLSPGGLEAREEEVAGREAARSSWTLTLPAHAAITARSRVEYDGVSYEVLNVNKRVPWEISRRVALKLSD